MAQGFRVDELARRVRGTVTGDEGLVVQGVRTLDAAGPQHLAFLAHPRYRRAAAATRAGAVLVGPGVDLPGRTLLRVAEPYVALAVILEMFHPPRPPKPGVAPTAVVDPEAALGRDVGIGPHAVVGRGATLADRVVVGAGSVVGEGVLVGEGTVIHPRVVLYPGTRVGARCLLHSGVVLGADGFGFATRGGKHRKIPQVGGVVLEDDVEIGANSTVDRGALDDTVIGEGTKIDDLVMVAHGVKVGAHCLLVGQAGVAGSTRLGSGVTLAGQAGVAGHLEVGDGAAVAAKSAVFEDVPADSVVAGIPAVSHAVWKRAQALVRRLPELRRRVRELEQRLADLEGRRLKEDDR